MNPSDLDRLLAQLDALSEADRQLSAPPRIRARVLASWNDGIAASHRFPLRWWSFAGLAGVTAALLLLAVLLGRTRTPSPTSLALVEAVDGSLSQFVDERQARIPAGGKLPNGVPVRTDSAGRAQIALIDGSRVEMRSNSALAVERASDGIRIVLDQGDIIVQAARQRAGHLYVQTRDANIAVVGTVFLVNAARDGSRVAVIEGEVRVQRGASEKRLHPGEQITTSPALEAIPVREEIAWSRRAESLGHLLQSALSTGPTLAPAQGVTAPFEVLGGNPQFDVTSIRPCDGSVVGNRGGPSRVSPGRMTVTCQTVGGLINAAYRLFAEGRSNPYSHVQIVGGPGWIHSERYTIAATAPGNASPALMQGPMLQALLEARFRVKVHQEIREVPVYNLTVANGGHKLQPHQEGSCTPAQPPSALSENVTPLPEGAVLCVARARRVGPNMNLEWRRATIQQMAWFLGINLDRPVVDRTGLVGFFDASVEFTPDLSNPRVPPGPPSNEPGTAPSLFTAIEEQLGLKLRATTGPGDFIVIDDVQRPTEN